MTSESKIHLWLSIAQLTTIAGFVIWASFFFGTTPNQVRETVRETSQKLSEEVAVLTESVDKLRQTEEARSAWTQQITKTLVGIEQASPSDQRTDR